MDGHHIPSENNDTPPPRRMCTDCGISRTQSAKDCGQVCQFIKPDYPSAERRIHGRARNSYGNADELFFGVTKRMLRASLKDPKPGAQWTGITTELAKRALEAGLVEAILTVGPDPSDRWKPVPLLVTKPEDMAKARGMRMGFAPVLKELDTIKGLGIKKLGVVGIPCQIYALRAMEEQLGLDALYVIGTPCSDNTTTAKFHKFLEALDTHPDSITYLEFRSDYRVELRYENGRKRLIPFLKLPLADLPQDFFPLTCQTCVDYTNSLSDITIGYMAGDGDQWLIARNDRGLDLLTLIEADLKKDAFRDEGDRTQAVEGFLENTARAAGGLPLRRIPKPLRGLVGWIQRKFGPKGLEFARARVEMKAIETILHLRRKMPRKMHNMVPDHVWQMAEPYGLFKDSTAEGKPFPKNTPPGE